MNKPNRHACVIALLLLTCGCQSSSTPSVQMVVEECKGVVHVAHRAKLDPAHAQRIIGITGDGDQGLITLQACQVYAKEVSGIK